MGDSRGPIKGWSLWVDALVEIGGFVLVVVVGLPFLAIWSLSGSLPLAIVATPILAAGLVFAGKRFMRWWRSI